MTSEDSARGLLRPDEDTFAGRFLVIEDQARSPPFEITAAMNSAG